MDEKTQRSQVDLLVAMGGLLIAYALGKKVGKYQTTKMFKVVNSCSCSQ